MKKFWKILGIVAATLFVVLVIAVVLVIRALPSPAEIGRALRPATVRTALKPPTAMQETTPAPTTQPPETPQATEPPDEAAISANVKSAEDQKILDDMMNPQKPLTDFCAYLRNAPAMNTSGMNLTDFGKKFKQSALTEEKDPIIQAIKPSLRYVLNQPEMRGLIDEAMAAVNRGEEAEGLMSKAGFYTKAYSAFTELRANKPRIESIMDRTYNLLIMSRVIAKKPELLGDPRVTDYCRSIESAINGGVPSARAEEQAEFQKFMAESGVDPKSVGYDPNYRTDLTVTIGAAGVHMKGGWIDSVLRPTQKELRSIESRAKTPEQ